ncbi:MAG: hypothetical protein GY749_42835 [Desulfobacteraceae bacterium]|nr:hypothetical protein [Desulfobacteraceae bacterium]
MLFTDKHSDNCWMKIEKELDREVKRYVKSVKKAEQKDARSWDFTSFSIKKLSFRLVP